MLYFVGGGNVALIYIVEPCETGLMGSLGPGLVAEALRRSGHRAIRVRLDQLTQQLYLLPEYLASACAHTLNERPAAWFVSCLYVRQWLYLPAMFKSLRLPAMASLRADNDPLVVFGGQTMIAPAPVSRFADICCLGDGEITGVEIADMIDKRMTKRQIMHEMEGRTGYWVPQSEKQRFARCESHDYTPALISRLSVRKTHIIEVARGCRNKCAYCAIGWAGGKYREADHRECVRLIESCHGGRLNLFAPEYIEVRHRKQYEQAAAMAGCKLVNRDARLDKMLGSEPLNRTEYSFGIDGLSERLRQAVGKPLSNRAIAESVAHILTRASVKLYMIIGYPGETEADWDEFRDLIEALAPHTKRHRLEISPNMLQSVPHTPLGNIDAHFQQQAHDGIMAIRTDCRRRWEQDKCMITTLMPKGRETHEHDSVLQRMGPNAAEYIVRLNGRQGCVQDGRWRSIAAASGIDVESLLLPQVSLAWSFVDVGISRQSARAAYERYSRGAA